MKKKHDPEVNTLSRGNCRDYGSTLPNRNTYKPKTVVAVMSKKTIPLVTYGSKVVNNTHDSNINNGIYGNTDDIDDDTPYDVYDEPYDINDGIGDSIRDTSNKPFEWME